VRRCLRAFLVGLIALSLLGGPAHACWRSRQQRHCRPVVVVTCPPPAPPGWRECGDLGSEMVVGGEHSCPPAPACCGAGEFVGEEYVVVDGGMAGPGDATVIETVVGPTVVQPPVVDSQPTLAAETRTAGLEPVVPPPTLAPAGEASPVQTTSNEQPVSEPAIPAAIDTPPAVEPVAESVLADRAEMEPPAGEEAAVAGAPPAEPVPLADSIPAADEAGVLPATEPEMQADEPLLDDEPVAGDSPQVDSEPATEPPMEEDVPALEPPQPAQPDPVQPEPEPEADNIFEELDAEGGDSAPDGAEGDWPAEPAAVEPGADAVEPADESPVEPGADVFGDEPVTEPEMTEEQPAAGDEGDGELADPFAADQAAPADAPATPATDGESPAEPAADPFAGSEPVRRWIDATGTASLVATLLEVGADGRCVLETGGRRIAVPVENLSGHDRDYVRQAGVRLAKLKADKAGATAAATPAPTDTAGL
jgi:hypothetical protein